jgi:hypothetical protein
LLPSNYVHLIFEILYTKDVLIQIFLKINRPELFVPKITVQRETIIIQGHLHRLGNEVYEKKFTFELFGQLDKVVIHDEH